MRDEEFLKGKLAELLNLPAETEWVEFKQAKQSFSFKELGQYFSALSNEANLMRQPRSWLVFGVHDQSRQIIDTHYRPDRPSLDSLKHEISEQTTNGTTFVEIHELQTEQGRVIMFEIPPAPPGIPIAWKGHYYGRNGESLVALSLQELEQIRSQVAQEDWTAAICEAATIDDLDEVAVAQAQRQFSTKQNAKAGEVMAWSPTQFLDRAKLTAGGKITRTALLLLGRAESAAHLLSPAPAQITWRLEGEERDYRHFGPPFLRTVNELYNLIRNTNFKIQPANRLVPIEISKYDSWVVMEALHNCIAHQDYTQQARVVVTETADKLILENLGSFYEGTPDDYVLQNRTPMRYRNPFLARAMVNLDMIDTMGYGIKRMFIEQRKRFFPLPDYDLTVSDRVRVEIMGRVIDENYTQLLIEKQDLDFQLVVALDKVQKHRDVSVDDLKVLRRHKLVEGRRPNIHVAAHVAATIDSRAEYIRHRAFDDDHYIKMLLELIGQFGEASRLDVDRLLLDKLSDVLTDEQKASKIHNLLTIMRRRGLIRNAGSRRVSKWVLAGGDAH